MREVRVVAAVLLRRDRVFVARRSPDQHQGGLWEFPGGKVEPGEEDAAALVRELQEELSVTATVGPVLAENRHDYPGIRVHLVAMRATIPGCSEPLLVDHDAAVWATAADLEALDWAPADVPLLPAVRDALSAGDPPRTATTA